MTIFDFDMMTGMKKMQVLSEKAIYLCQKKEGCFKISLYQIEDFYVEIYFHTTQHSYKSIRTFNDTGDLEGYLEQIDISQVYTYLNM
jgi:hypothetical protein